jgi:trimeric autotransporter adhesin
MSFNGLILTLGTITAAAQGAATAIDGITTPAAPQASAATTAASDLLAKLQGISDNLTLKINGLTQNLTDSNAKLDAMREAAGLNTDSGIGAENKKLSDDLNEARARLQYLEDKSTGTDADKQAIADKQKAVDDMTAKMDESTKQLRIAEYELTHSDAYQAQLAQIAAEQKAQADYQAQQAEEVKQLDAAKADLAAKQAADVAAAAAAAKQASADLAAKQAENAAKQIAVIKSTQEAVQQQVQQATTAIATATTQATTTISTAAATAVETAGAAITAKLSDAMQSLMDLIANPSSGDISPSSGPGSHDFGTQYAGVFFDSTGQAGGSIGDATYATYVQAFIDSVARYKADNSAGNQKYQGAEALAQKQLEDIWIKTGGYARFHETLAQIADALKKQTAVAPAPHPAQQQAAAISKANLYMYMPPPPKPPAPPPPATLQAMLSTGQL